MPFSPNHHKPSVTAGRGRLHFKSAPLIDDRKDFASQIDNAFKEFRGLGKPGDLARYARDFVHGVDRQRKLVVIEAKHDESEFVRLGRVIAFVHLCFHRGFAMDQFLHYVFPK